MIISVASGKGGTGKTTISTNLAWSLGSGAQLLDCDVEEPNSHLFLKPVIEETESVSVMVPEIDEAKCTYCKKCSDICRFNAITVLGESILTFPQLCHSCEGCLVVCPEKAITESKREIGVLEIGHRDDLKFLNGRLKIGEAMSPPLIKQVRKNSSAELINIIDAPPGTSCPVIAATKGVDFVLLVTEPTPFGFHDLQLAVEVVKSMGIPCGLVINRSDIGDNSVKNYAEKENIPILMEIPFDRHIAEIYSKGKLIVEEIPEQKAQFLDLFDKIKKIIRKNSDRN